MLSKNKIKFINSLQLKKNRDKEGVFVIEGDKIVREFLAFGFPLKYLAAKGDFIDRLKASDLKNVNEKEVITDEELKKISFLKTPNNALAVAVMPDNLLDVNSISREYLLALDFIQDPGNLGTIIRAAAWFGLRTVVCSPDSVDVYNPKVIQSCMGALLHVKVIYHDLKDLLEKANSLKVPVYGTLMDGRSIYSQVPGGKGVILLGNESKGISPELQPLITEKITIPKFSRAKEGIDSLNVGMAASIVLSEFMRGTVSISD
jgi:RNA methyltransferase, TrmH family